MEAASAFLSGILLPVLLIAAGVFFGLKLRFFWLLHPIKTVRTLLAAEGKDGTSPFAALTMALAGTLGVGNIAGVATAITAGGAGAVFWMLFGAFTAMAVKYAEVYLAVLFRRYRTENGHSVRYGGAMYYIRDGFLGAAHGRMAKRAGALLGGVFAVLCAVNALLTGNVIQVRAAVSCVEIPPLLFGVLFAIPATSLMTGGMRHLSRLTVVLIPLLSALYILLSGVILVTNAGEIPRVCGEIVRDAFRFDAVGGGVLGLTVSRAVRFGITRGIFSNEAGCGTAPTAHAAADTVSPHHQGCFGIFEVFADTVLLCTLTALVILLYENGGGLDGIELSLAAYTCLGREAGGAWLGIAADSFMRISVVLFAFATVVCQSFYGVEAIRYFIPSKSARTCYIILSAAAILTGSLIQPDVMWQIADVVVSGMTVLNVLCLFFLRRHVKPPKK